MRIRIEQHSSLRKSQQNNKPWLPPFQQLASNAESTAALWVRRTRAIQFAPLETPNREKGHPGRSLIAGIPVTDVRGPTAQGTDRTTRPPSRAVEAM